MTLLEREYQQFLDEIGWDEFEPIEKSYFFEELGPEPGDPGAVLHILQSKTKLDHIVIKHINTGTKLEIPQDQWSEFRDWIENTYANGEDGAAYYSYIDAINKEDMRDAREFNSEQNVLTKLKKHCSPYRIGQGPLLDESNRLYYPDFVVYDEKREVQVVIEVKAIQIPNQKDIIDRVFGRLYHKYPNAHFVLTDGGKAIVWYQREITIQKFDDLIAKILPIQVVEEKTNDAEIRTFFTEVLEKLLQSLPSNIIDKKAEKKEELKTFIEGLQEKDIKHDKNDPSVVYLTSGKEKEFILKLLGSYGKKTIVKFSSANSFKDLLDKGTIGMCSLVCMNDPSEVNYADKMVAKEGTIDDAADSFIISACDESRLDDLTIWRLYADDTKGVGLKFKIDYRKVRGEFFLAPVSYGDKDYHWELEIIKALLHASPFKGRRFVLKDWLVWKHFFKNYSYAVEEEIRLLYQPKKAAKKNENVWFKDARTSIYSELRLFDMTKKRSRFPLRLSQIILGTSFPILGTNKEQIRKWFGQTNIVTDTRIEEIVDFRKFEYRSKED